MGNMFSASFEGAAITNANGDYDYFELSPADDHPVIIHAVYVSFYSEVGDAAEEMIRWGIIRGHTVSGSTPNNSNEVCITDSSFTAYTSAEALNSTIANTGTTQQIHADAFNLRIGLIYVPTPEMRPMADQGDTTIVVRQFSTLTDDANANGTIYWEEL
jgi:hypothetical protein